MGRTSRRDREEGVVKLWFVYLCRCRDGSLYCGVTTDPARRVAAHNFGRGARYTRGRGPVALVWLSVGMTWSAALREERRVKRLPREGKIELVHGPDGLRGGT